MIAHREESLSFCDRIIRLQNGRLPRLRELGWERNRLSIHICQRRRCAPREPEVCMTSKSRSFFFVGLITLVLGGALCTAPAATARSQFDGNWSVLIVTDSGNCDRAYRYALHIANGGITYPDQSIAISGHVSARGRVHVNVDAGGQYASGSGRISGDTGAGTWSGHSSTSQCSGHWQAERRG
jgi:hypothetical protein